MSGRRERAGACRNCRIRKRRCISTGLAKSCQLCQVLSVPCSLVPTRPGSHTQFAHGEFSASPLSDHGERESTARQYLPANLHSVLSPFQVLSRPQTTSIPISSQSTYPSLLPAGPVLIEVIDLYFRLIHNGPHTLFHKPSFWSDVDSGAIPEMVLFGMIALSIRFSKQDCFQNFDPRTRGTEFADEARRLIHLEMMNPSIGTVQTCILIGHYFGGEGDARSKHIYLGIARLHAQTIRLWEMPEDSTTVSKEIRRRTWLSVTIADSWSATDMSTQPMISREHETVLPILDDVEFLAMQPGILRSDLSYPPSENSMWAQMAGTIDIFRRISNMITSLGLNLKSVDSYRQEISHLAQQLDQWIERLPPKLRYSAENLSYFGNAGVGLTFLGMHMGYHHFRQLLYYPFLNPRMHRIPDLQSQDFQSDENYARLCKEHAIAISDIIKAGFQASGSNAVYFLTGHILVVSSSIHLHTLLLGDDLVEADMAHQRLVSNFEILMLLKMYWPVIDSSVARLRAFQNSCRLSISDSFVLDNWMLKFLMEHTAKFGPDSRPAPQPQLEAQELPFQSFSGEPSAFPGPPDPGHSHYLPVESSQALSTEPVTATAIDGFGTSSLSTLLNDKDMSNEAMVENALSWLLDQNVPVSEYWPQSYVP